MERATVWVTGVVQSVGFRPFVYRQAVAKDLRGTVENRGDAGVRIVLEGDADGIDAVLEAIRTDPPPLATVNHVEAMRESIEAATVDGFEIVESDTEAADVDGGGTIPPDTAICDRCLADVRDPDSRFAGYWATACVDCGPRYTVVEDLPYDRPRTSMAAFPMCASCRADYEDPADRRYHAQAIACPDCGPSLVFGGVDESANADGAATAPSTDRDPVPPALDCDGDGRAAVGAAADAIAAGDVVVIKGVGGAHLACDATRDAAVERLRSRTGRPEKPFAVMAADEAALDAVASLTSRERAHLTAPARPIVLLRSDGESLADGIAPGLHTVGLMLPYSGVHHLLFEHLENPVVMTSANPPGHPMYRANEPLVAGLADVADGFLLHDRRIVTRCDDSVVRVVDGDRRFVRRSRGSVPTPVAAPGTGDARVLAVGPALDVAVGVLAGGECYLTQYVGDVDDPATFAAFEAAIEQLLAVTGLDPPPVLAHDAHPAFRTTEYARQRVADGVADRAVAVQHHHAHAASVLGEHDRAGAVAITVDGVGHGPDGTVWGGEVLDAGRADFERVGGLAPVPMPGGDRATRHPARLAAGLLHAHDADTVARTLDRHDVAFPGGREERDVVVQQLSADVNVPRTSSAGRFLDAVSALLGVCSERTYEGEPAMKLEAVAAGGSAADLNVPRTAVDGRPVVDTPRLFARLVDELADGAAASTVAATAQACLARGLGTLAVEAADERGRDAVALSGGVAYNDHVARTVRERVTDAGLSVLVNQQVPAGDGGIAYGQAVVAAARTG